MPNVLDAYFTNSDSVIDSNQATVLVVYICVVPAAAEFVVATVVTIVVRAVAAIAANEEQCPSIFLVEESRCVTPISFSPSSAPSSHASSCCSLLSFCRTLSLTSSFSQTDCFMMYTFFFSTPPPFCYSRLSFSSHLCIHPRTLPIPMCSFTTTATTVIIHRQLMLLRFCRDHGRTDRETHFFL